MADALTNISNFIISPPGQLTAGAAVAGIVWKFFEKVESVLKDDTKLEIAVWLVGITMENLIPWPQTFIKLFDSRSRHVALITPQSSESSAAPSPDSRDRGRSR
jgi:hypothetical protein